MYSAEFYDDQKRGKAQARTMRRMDPAKISVETWLNGYRHLFPGDGRSEKVKYDQWLLLRKFWQAHKDMRMWDVTAIDAQAWVLKHPSHRKVLREAWRKAVVMRVAPFDIWSVVVMPPRKKERVRAPGDVELATILKAAGNTAGETTPFGDMILVAAYTGCRQAGLVGLRRRDVNLADRRMTVTEKGGKTREVVLGGPAWAAMGRQMLRSRLHIDGRLWMWDAKKVQIMWREVRGDFPHGFHSLRHYAATWLRSQGLDPLDIATQLGHTGRDGKPYVQVFERVYDHHVDTEGALARIAAAL